MQATPPRRYVSADEDSARWAAVELRDGDIVVSTRSKSGTTWVQMICALLVHGSPDLPEPLPRLSPWVDHTVEPVADVAARIEAQRHRRILKTHTPLDGVPRDPRVRYVVAARHPLDMAVSLYHQGDNIDRERLAELTGVTAGPQQPRPSLHDWLVRWTRHETTPQEAMDSLVGVAHHVQDAWARQEDPAAGVLLVHYADLSADLEGTMRRIADHLGATPPQDAWPALVDAATFASMRRRSAELAPNPLGVLKDGDRFFRSGRSGEGEAVLTPVELAAYEARMGTLVSADVLTWLHRPGSSAR